MLRKINLHCQQQQGDILMVDKLQTGLTEIIIYDEDSRSMNSVKLDDEQVKHLTEALIESMEDNYKH